MYVVQCKTLIIFRGKDRNINKYNIIQTRLGYLYLELLGLAVSMFDSEVLTRGPLRTASCTCKSDAVHSVSPTHKTTPWEHLPTGRTHRHVLRERVAPGVGLSVLECGQVGTSTLTTSRSLQWARCGPAKGWGWGGKDLRWLGRYFWLLVCISCFLGETNLGGLSYICS